MHESSKFHAHDKSAVTAQYLCECVTFLFERRSIVTILPASILILLAARMCSGEEGRGSPAFCEYMYACKTEVASHQYFIQVYMYLHVHTVAS